MAGLESYRKVYRGVSVKSSENENYLPHIYQGREVIRPLDVPTLHYLAEDSPSSDEDLSAKKYVVAGCGLATLIAETLLVHPLIVLRRQCQVNPGLNNYHIEPFTLIPVVVRLHQTQGINALWKGIGSVLLVKGILVAVEDIISKVTPWPKEISCSSSLKAFGQHVLLKCVSIGLVTPFYSASLVETVQSDIASESPGIFDVFRDGAIRLIDVNNKGRLIPIYALLAPTIAYKVSKYFFTLAVRGITSRIMHIRRKYSQEIRGAYSRDLLLHNIELRSALVSTFVAEALFYPWQTVIYRLHLQGTRTIIDNLDTGRSVIPLLTGYSDARDCYNTIISTEGPLGLYKGFGAFLLEFTINTLIVRVIKWIVTELEMTVRPKIRDQSQQWYYNDM